MSGQQSGNAVESVNNIVQGVSDEWLDYGATVTSFVKPELADGIQDWQANTKMIKAGGNFAEDLSEGKNLWQAIQNNAGDFAGGFVDSQVTNFMQDKLGFLPQPIKTFITDQVSDAADTLTEGLVNKVLGKPDAPAGNMFGNEASNNIVNNEGLGGWKAQKGAQNDLAAMMQDGPKMEIAGQKL